MNRRATVWGKGRKYRKCPKKNGYMGETKLVSGLEKRTIAHMDFLRNYVYVTVSAS